MPSICISGFDGMGSYDECYLCHWHVTGPTKRVPGRGEIRTEVWCGAGRPEFHNGGLCPTRIPFVELEFTVQEHPEIVLKGWHGVDYQCQLQPDVKAWMKENLPKCRVEETYDDCLCIRFDRPESVVIFKMFWL